MEPTIPLFPDQASTVAARVDNLYFFMIAVSAFFAVVVTVMVVFFAIKFRRRHDDEVGEPIHGSLALELIWTGIPFLIAMVMFVWGSSVYFAIARVPEETLDIYAVGKQWMWKFQHREGQREINELHVPVDTPVRMIITSEDVLHDLYFPSFRVKTDAIPGRYTQVWFNATKSRHVPHLLRRVLRDQALGHDRLGARAAGRRVPGVARRHHHRGVDGAAGREAVHAAGVHHLSQRRTRRAADRRSTASGGTPCSWPTATR